MSLATMASVPYRNQYAGCYPLFYTDVACQMHAKITTYTSLSGTLDNLRLMCHFFLPLAAATEVTKQAVHSPVA
mgnify:CR=1 FL=1